MRIILSSVFLATIFVFGFAQEKPTTLSASSTTLTFTKTPLRAESGVATLASVSAGPFSALRIPVTEDDLNAILDKVADTSVELKKLEVKMENLKPRIDDFVKRRDTHDANRCTYPEGHPEDCQGYERERKQLDEERDGLKGELDDNVRQQGILKSRMGLLRARIRITTMLLYACACDNLKPEATTACWSQCFDGANPRLKSCLDLSDADTAGCLERLRHPKDEQ